MVTKEDVMRVLKNVKDPEIGASIVSLGMVRAIEVQGSTVHVEIALTIPNCPLRETIRDDVIKAVSDGRCRKGRGSALLDDRPRTRPRLTDAEESSDCRTEQCSANVALSTNGN